MTQALSSEAIPSWIKDPNAAKVDKLVAKRIEVPIPCLKDKYVVAIPNAFSMEECGELIAFSENIGYKDALVNLGFGYKEIMNEFRNHKKLSVDNKSMANYIFERIKSVIPQQFNNRRVIDINERLRFLRYSPNEYFGPHYDGMYVRDNGQRSLITIVIYLNDNYNGGEFTFLHPTNENKTHSIKPQTGMILLFEQNEIFHQGSIVLSNNNNNDDDVKSDENIFKYLIRSDIMYSKQLKYNINNSTMSSYEVEKQKVYFERNAPLKSSQHQPKFKKHKRRKMNKLSDDSLVKKVINCWFIDYRYVIFPEELYEEIAKFCRIIGFLDFAVNSTELVSMARVSETAERYDDMVEIMSELVQIKSRSFKCKCQHQGIDTLCNKILNIEERNLLSVAYKNVVGSLRASWRTLNGVDNIDEYVCNEYKRMIERKLHEICMRLIDLLQICIVEKINVCTCTDSEDLVFYMKMIGDYNRYLAEFMESIPIYKQRGEKYYSEALEIGKRNLSPNNPTLLGLSLNYAVFLYEIAKESEKACLVSKGAFDLAIEHLNELSNENYKDSTLIMRLLRDNLTLWTSDDIENDNHD